MLTQTLIIEPGKHQELLKSMGINIIIVWKNDIKRNIDNVINTLTKQLSSLPTS